MVLKNTNSSFNSGNTQRLCNRGAYSTELHVTSSPEASFSITLEGIPSFFVPDNPSQEHAKALQKVYDYLGFSGPSLKTFYDSQLPRFSRHDKRTLSYTLDKKDYWLLPNRVNALMKDKNLLVGEEGIAEIHVHIVTNNFHNNRPNRKRSVVLRCKPDEAKTSKKEDRENRKGQSRQNSRGVQRPHLHPQRSRRSRARNDDDDDDEEERDSNNKKVVIEISEDHIDTRTLHGPMNKCPHRNRKYKSLYKTKGWKNGRYAEGKGYTLPQMTMDKELASDDLYNDYLYHTKWLSEVSDEEENITDEEDEEECHYFNDPTVQTLVISEKRRRVQLPRNHDKTKDRNRNLPILEEREFVNTASSQVTTKYPKGSFEFIDRSRAESFENPSDDSSTDEDFIQITMDDVTDTDSGFAGMESDDLNSSAEESLMISQKIDALSSRDKYVKVDLALPDEMQEDKMASCPQVIRGCPVVFAKCFPSVFQIKLALRDENGNSSDAWSLIGASSSKMPKEDLTWEVTLKNSQISDSELGGVVKDCLLSQLELDAEENIKLSLDRLTEIALSAVSVLTGMTKVGGEEHISDIDSDVCGDSMPSSLAPNESPSCQVLTLDKALARLHCVETKTLDCRGDVTVNDSYGMDISNNQNVTHSSCLECGVCFDIFSEYGFRNSGLISPLPCHHAFCFECWQSHVYFTFMSGDCEIKCMDVDCKELLDEPTLHALMPEQFMTKLCQKKKERTIEVSPMSKWCPGTKCDRVAVLDQWRPSISQFGCPVVCSCNRSWCFTCQTTSHWPVSCCQVGAYRKLLVKIGDDLPWAGVDYNIDLKPCPNCKYPIEKNFGCPHMECSMCQFNFCWKCLQSTKNHHVWECTASESDNFTTYQLHNECISSFPLKFFHNCVELRRRYNRQRKAQIHSWLHGLSLMTTPRHCRKKVPFLISVQQEQKEFRPERAASLAHECVAFCYEALQFLELFNLLLSFAFVSKTKKDMESKRKAYLTALRHASLRLEFVVTRLEELVLWKKLDSISKVASRTEFFLASGHALRQKLVTNVRILQKISRDVATDKYAEMDPQKYFRYR